MLILYGNENAWLCWCPGRCGCILSRLPGDDSCMTAGHRETHRAMLGGEGCYKVSPSHTHKQDTITDTQCGCPFVWFIGDVVANVASVSLRGSGRLQIFPSQQEVQIWKKVRKQRVSWGQVVSEGGGASEGIVYLLANEKSVLQKQRCLTFRRGKNSIPSRSNVLHPHEKFQPTFQGTYVTFLASHLP